MPITRASRANRTLLLNEIKFAFGSIVSEFLFPTRVQKTILMKILVLCVINSSQHRCLCQKLERARYERVRVFDTNNS